VRQRVLCDHTSVGILVERAGKLLLIERKKPPFGFAPPAGHVDAHMGADGQPDFESAARAELLEEVGLRARELTLLAEGRRDNPCRRPEGTWHYWKIYKAAVSGRPKPSLNEVKKIVWCSQARLRMLAERTRHFEIGTIDENEWFLHPGLEPVWVGLLQKVGML
jgi:ADP-ribose pyrophosphatase YjhB (NUDIX family)